MTENDSHSRSAAYVALGICTYQRPDGLLRLLRTLEQIEHGGRLEIIVVDNHPGQDGIVACKTLSTEYRWPLRAVHEPVAGIAQARNRIVDEALATDAEFIAMLDDDEWPEREWLAEMLRVQAAGDYDFVGGPVKPVFADNRPPPWYPVGALYYGAERDLPDGAECVLYASGNFLGRTAIFRALQEPAFDSAYSASGGEDLAFFTRMARAGYRMGWSSRGVVHEEVPPSRMSLDWLRQRVIRASNLNVVVQSGDAPGLKAALLRWLKTLVLGLLGVVGAVVGMVYQPMRVSGRMAWWKFRGRWDAHLAGLRQYQSHGGN